jgi:hypothetical protein
MVYFGVTLGSGKRVIVDAPSQDSARALARRDHPEEEIVDAVFLTVLGENIWTPTGLG